ncbi:DUF4091 domain-containing protein [Flavivirga spongiicola]|uniref:DUF4091 domain-containing protein n=1 Tax=Flavivirga spongiicola TaxID=421621 RepID=A0ABU7XPP6_9FLAO|nr:DUF4091 domain-containing protein [Flavivirga sp. MEBiC05379]MDO5977418.1 DUF4091 domain-containing protein [Flavivirga sp. MEBiC05379]
MKKTLVVISLILVQYSVYAQKISLFDELAPLYPDTKIIEEVNHITLHAPKGGVLSVNILLNKLEEKDIIKINHNLEGLFYKVKTCRLLDVPVEENTGLDSRTEQYTNQTNPHVLRRAPFRVYEVLQPITFPFFSEHKTEAFNIKWAIPKQLSEGTYESTLEIKGLNFSKILHVTTVVHKSTVPDSGYNTYGYTNWFSLKRMAKSHDVDMWSQNHWELIKKYAEIMAEGRQNVFWVTLSDMFEKVQEVPQLQSARLEKLIKIFSDAGIYYIEFSPLAHRTKGDWSSTTLSSNLNSDMLVNSEEGYAFYETVFTQLKKIIDKNEWNGRIMFHISDEPTDEVVDDYKLFVKHLRKYFENASILEATMTLGLSDAVDYWCPQVQEYQKHQEFFENKKKAGDQVWVYTCLIPGGKWLNRLLDQHKLRQVYLGWSLAKFELGGYLHWGLNHYNSPNPFIKSVVDHPQLPNTKNKLPAGDTHIIYPGINEPWVSLRFNAHRIGLEDAELFKILEKKERIKLMESCFKLFDDYKTDIALYRKVRKRLLEKLDKN